MPIIAKHHLDPDDYLGGAQGHSPRTDWPEDTYVQWGCTGVVLGSPSYTTAFFEAFPAGGGFIRGEGKTIPEAEERAHAQWIRQSGCAHRFGRRGRMSGAAICIDCGARCSNVFAPVSDIAAWRAPLSTPDLQRIINGWLRARSPLFDPTSARQLRKLYLRARLCGIDLPETPQGYHSSAEYRGAFPDPYRSACREAVARWLEGTTCTLSPETYLRAKRMIESSRRTETEQGGRDIPGEAGAAR